MSFPREMMLEGRTRNVPHTLRSPSALIAAAMLSPAVARTARKPSSTRDWIGNGTEDSVSMSRNAPSLSGSGISEVSRPRAALSLAPQDQI